MNNFEIDEIMSKLGLESVYGGIYPCDLLPMDLCKRCNYGIICNQSNSQSYGTHWVAIFMPKQGSLEFFNSYGIPPKNEYFLKFIEKDNIYYCYNSVQIQDYNSDVCGQYCIFFLICRFLGIKFDQFINIFDKKNLEQNDQFIEELIGSLGAKDGYYSD